MDNDKYINGHNDDCQGCRAKSDTIAQQQRLIEALRDALRVFQRTPESMENRVDTTSDNQSGQAVSLLAASAVDMTSLEESFTSLGQTGLSDSRDVQKRVNRAMDRTGVQLRVDSVRSAVLRIEDRGNEWLEELRTKKVVRESDLDGVEAAVNQMLMHYWVTGNARTFVASEVAKSVLGKAFYTNGQLTGILRGEAYNVMKKILFPDAGSPTIFQLVDNSADEKLRVILIGPQGHGTSLAAHQLAHLLNTRSITAGIVSISSARAKNEEIIGSQVIITECSFAPDMDADTMHILQTADSIVWTNEVFDSEMISNIGQYKDLGMRAIDWILLTKLAGPGAVGTAISASFSTGIRVLAVSIGEYLEDLEVIDTSSLQDF